MVNVRFTSLTAACTLRGSPHHAGFAFFVAAEAILTPVKQGSIDGLCGVYAVLNACRLLAVTGDERIPSDIRWDQTKRLFQALCLSDETRELFPHIVCVGTREGGLERLLSVARGWATRHSGVELTVEQIALPRDCPRSFFAALRTRMRNGGGARKAFILGLSAPHDHWTVVRRIGPERVTLFDSGVFPTARRDYVHFGEFAFERHDEPPKRKRYVIDTASSYLLTSRHR